MSGDTPQILIASVSAHERRRLERLLGGAGAIPVGVEDARAAERHWSAHEQRPVLVIDAGLLRAVRDPQWRALRGRQPALGAVVRSLVRRVRRADSRTFLAPPDDDVGILRAVQALQGPSLPLAHVAQPRTSQSAAAVASKARLPE